jgi:hypothetical protein
VGGVCGGFTPTDEDVFACDIRVVLHLNIAGDNGDILLGVDVKVAGADVAACPRVGGGGGSFGVFGID